MNPTDPTGPVDPTDPMGPANPADPAGPGSLADPAGPVGTVDPPAPAGPSRRWRYPALLLVAAAVMALSAVLARGLARGPAEPAVPADRPAPKLSGTTLDGTRFTLGELRGHVVLVNVWASWCESCREEFPLVVETARRLGPRGLRIVGVDTRDTREAARLFLRESGVTDVSVPVQLFDPDGRLALELGVLGVPETFLVGRDGRIADRVLGPVTQRWIDRAVLPRLTR
ncbi:hypothetical protein GCM10027187_04940 [Streptosporangium sandarakinum]